MNGEIGQVIAVEPEKFLVTISWEGGAVVNYYPGDFEQIMHSFCITCHKSQGSQFPYVIFPLVRANYRMLTRQLLYTTMTRAMGTFIAVGQHEALKTAVATDKRISRFPIRNLPAGIAHRLYWRVVNEWNIVRFSRFSCDYWFLLNHRGCIFDSISLKKLVFCFFD